MDDEAQIIPIKDDNVFFPNDLSSSASQEARRHRLLEAARRCDFEMQELYNSIKKVN